MSDHNIKKELLSLVKETKAFLSSHYSLKDSFFFSDSEWLFKKINPNQKPPSIPKIIEQPNIQENPLIQTPPPPQKQTVGNTKISESAKLYRAQESVVNLDSAKQNQMECSIKNCSFPMKPEKIVKPVDSMEDLFSLFSQLKLLKIIHEIPDDSLAKELAEAWKNPSPQANVVLLFLKGDPKEQIFVENLVKAISLRLKSAKIVDAALMEKEKKWDQLLLNSELKWIMCYQKLLSSLPHLKSLYRYFPTNNQHFLGDIPVFFLEPFSSYAQNPLLKKQLWEKLCQVLKN